MPRTFDWRASITSGPRSPARLWLQTIGGVLALLNGVALFFYLAPPGGSRQDLAQQSLEVRHEIAATRVKAARMRSAATKVELGNSESTDFESKYFLPKRTAYAMLIGELQRMAKESGLQERDAVYTEEPIEGTSDLSILNSTANYEGPYTSLLRFLYEVDQSPMLLILENLQAAPQQKSGQIATSIHFQAIMQEQADPVILAGAQP